MKSVLTAIAVLLAALSTAPSTLAAPAGSPGTSAILVKDWYPGLAKTLLFDGWMSYPDRYERFQHTRVLTPGSAKVRLFTNNFATGGTAVPFGADATLTLTLDGKPAATAAVKAGDVGVTFDVDVSSLAEGWYVTSVSGLDATWSVLDYAVYVMKGAAAQAHAWMPVTTASHELIFKAQQRYQQFWVPAKFQPVTIPYPAREFPPLTTVPARKDVVITSLAPPRPGDLYRTAVTKEGVLTTANRQNYFYFDFEQGTPLLPMLDGPRGRGSLISPVHLEVGSAAPNGALRGNVYFVESWRIGKVTPDGTVVTLAGYRHKDLATYWQDPNNAELIGDWSSIPAQRRGFAQPWGMAWDARTLTINTQAPPIPSEGNEQPHVLRPTMYISDTFHDRVLKIEFSATQHGVPPKVTEYITGLKQPWDVIAVGTKLYVSDRMNNAIKVYDMDTAALLQTIPVAQPEGMAYLDGWLYYSSVKTKSIRKRNLDTGQDVLIADPTVAGSSMGYYINNNSRYMKIAVSDGTFGPRGMIAYTTWSNSYYGYPILIDGSNGKMIDWLVTNGAQVKGFNPPLGSYSSAVGIGHGRMLFGTAEDGLHVVSAALPTDPVIDQARFDAGRNQWQQRGLGMTHGPGGFGFYGLPLPWGESADIDYFLWANGHGSAAPPPGGTSPNIGAAPSSLAFGSITVGQTSPAQTITVSNTGSGNATNMAYPAAPAGFVKSGSCSGATLNAGATCTVILAFAPTASGAVSSTYTITGGGKTLPIALTGTGTGAATPALTVTPTTLAFGNVTTGTSSAAKPVTVTNSGSASASGLALANANATEFLVSGSSCGTSLAAGASCSFGVAYVPNGAGADSANLTVTITGGAPVQVAMTGTGVAPAQANVAVSPASLAFGSVTVGTAAAAKAVTITNSGGAAASGLAIANGNAVEFVQSGSTCGASLAAGASCSLNVAYTPAGPGADSATLTVSFTGGSAVQVAMSGTGVAAAQASLVVAPSSLAFGSVTVGTSGSPKAVTITNAGTASASGLAIGNSNAAEFAQSASTCGASLAAGASCSLSVTYVPTGVGADAANLTVTYTGGSPQQVAMTGTGAAPAQPSISATPTSLAFGNVTVGQTSAAQTITVSNTGAGNATDMAYPAGPAPFTRSGTCAGPTLAAGTSCTVVFTYSPAAAATDNATYVITGGGTSLPIALSGTGTAQPAASLAVTPGLLVFGDVVVGNSSNARMVTVTNSGNADASGVTLASSNAAEFVVGSSTCGASLAAGASCSASLTYTPAGVGSDNATLAVAFAGGSASQVVLRGAGIAPSPPSLAATPASLAFGNVTVGTTSSTSVVTISNGGGAAVTGLAVAHSNAARFPVGTNTCGTTLNAGASCSLGIAYAPGAATADSATITVSSANAGSTAIALSGTGATVATARLSALPPNVTFGAVTVGQSAPAVAIVVRNTGNADASGLSVAGPGHEDFTLSQNTCTATLAAGATCGIVVAFAPTAEGVRTASLAWTYSGGSMSVALSGYGAAPASPPGTRTLAMPAGVALPGQVLGTASPPQAVTISNTGTTSVMVQSIRSSNAVEFPVSGSTCTFLAAGSSCSFNVAFAPRGLGARSATITVASDSDDGPRTIEASGNGLSSSVTVPPPPTASLAAAIEYYHAAFDHYFVTSIAEEIVKLDNGTFAGWSRTGQAIGVHRNPAAGTDAVCRFFSTAFGARSSHFYTPDAPECATVKSNPNWQFEGEVFYAASPARDGTCAAGTRPVYRLYNNGQGGAPNHRYTADLSVRSTMLARGWIPEGYGPLGVIMCEAQ